MEVEKSKILIHFLLFFRQCGDVLFFLYARKLRGYTATGTLKNSSNFEQRERKYANTWFRGGRARGQKPLPLYSFCTYNNLFSFRFHFYTLLKLQLNCEIPILPFSGP